MAQRSQRLVGQRASPSANNIEYEDETGACTLDRDGQGEAEDQDECEQGAQAEAEEQGEVEDEEQGEACE